MGKQYQIANIFGFILMLTMNTAAVVIPLGGNSTGDISDLYPNLFVPEGYAFSIWSVIYTLLLIFVILQAKGLFSKSKDAPKYVQNLGWWFLISCFANSFWIVAWHYLLVPVSLVLMLTILGSLIMIYRLLDVEKPSFIIRLPFSIYLGWITVATVANVTAFLVSIEWSALGLSEVTWTIIMVIIATIIGLIAFWQHKDIPYIAVIVWALIAIAIKRNRVGVPEEEIIITIIYLCLALIGVTVITRFLKKSKPSIV